jgi:hypothetical protein
MTVMPRPFHARVTAQLKLALLGDCGCDRTLARLEREARSAGLTGAEIDAARGGRSFEARTAAAVAYACALSAGNAAGIAAARARAQQFGMTEAELDALAERTKQILASAPQ